ncbi:hypothetical protein [Croceicoccus sp. BE223]|uniref:hypothetical protein n=1 Tax=Croceicoccus sp. BE223 TaxID=2817716 RepID=UPI002854B0B4|nr:hypothetical protein [Croceicoccus sp. BE223]MDR7102487.1 hypothetical protein [Croceicoccus sp. BE223]
MVARLALAIVLIAPALLAGCGSPPSAETSEPIAPPDSGSAEIGVPVPPVALPASATQLAEGFAPVAFDLDGTGWLVVAIDGKPLGDRWSDPVRIFFGRSSLEWGGCNSHSSLYVRSGASFVTQGSSISTLVACPPEAPDGIVGSVLNGRPVIGANAEGKIMLATKAHTLTLSQIDARPADVPPPPLERAPFRLSVADGGSQPPVLSFANGSFAIWMDCPAAISGKVEEREGRLITSAVVQTPCDTHRPTATGALAAFFEHGPAIARGPNGELLLSDGDEVIRGRQCHPDPSPCRHTAAK